MVNEWGELIYDNGSSSNEEAERLKVLLNEERDLFKRLTDHLQGTEEGKKILMQFLALERLEGQKNASKDNTR